MRHGADYGAARPAWRGIALVTVTAAALAGSVLAGAPALAAPAAAAPAALAHATAVSAAEQEGASVVEGTLEDGTAYRFLVPADWNGTVFVDLDFAGGQTAAPYVQHLVAQGAAYGGTTRLVTGWDIPGAIDNQVEAIQRLSQEIGEPQRAIAMGSSMGGTVSAGVAQRYPSVINGAVPMCGGLSGSISQWNQKLDTVFVLSELMDPEGTLPVIDIPEDVNGAVTAWQSALAAEQETPEGRARIGLAAAIGQLPAYSSSAERPASRDTTAYQSGWYGALTGDSLPYIGQAMSSRRTIESLTGGNPSWNVGVDYAQQFHQLPREKQKVVEELYRESGLSLQDDLQAVNGAERISADPAAVTQFEQGLEFNGDLRIPVLTMNNIGDQISTVAQQNEYENEVKAAGNGSLLRQIYVDSAGHCGFTDAEKVVAAETLLDRLDSGNWTMSQAAPQLNRRAEALHLGGGNFLRFKPEEFNRPYSPTVSG